MDALIARYLDGDLDEAEAAALLDAAARNPALAAELEELEDVLAAAGDLPTPEAGPAFVDDVMAAVRTAAGGRSVRRLPLPHLPRSLAAAAVLVLIVGAGFLAGRMTGGSVAAVASPSPARGVIPATLTGMGAGERLVRLVLPVSAIKARSLSVAGDFNDWDPAATPMRREGDVWTAYLVLPADVHQYMFVADGDRWVADPLADRTIDDGFGSTNAVLDLSL